MHYQEKKVALVARIDENEELKSWIDKYASKNELGETVIDREGRVSIDDTKSIDFIKVMHKRSVHAGMTVLYNNLKNYYKVNHVKRIIMKVISECIECKVNKRHVSKHKTNLQITSSKPFKKICSDIFGPFEHGKKDKRKKLYILSIVDVYSRLTKVYKVKEISEMQVLKCFNKWIEEYGKPDSIVMDNGKQYTSKNVKALAKRTKSI